MTEKRKPGRPPKHVDLDQLEKLAIMHCSNREIAAFFDISVDTVTDRFSELIAKGKEKGKIRLRRAMWQQATERNHAVMMIFLAKNLLGMADKVETKNEVTAVADESVKEMAAWISEIKKDDFKG